MKLQQSEYLFQLTHNIAASQGIIKYAAQYAPPPILK